MADSKPKLAEPAVALVDVDAVAAICSCSARHVYRMSDAGKMPPPLRLGALVRWNRDVIESWIAQGCPSVRNLKGSK
jgi:predicted DNA-binding transcriptional regulator AlpA